MRRAGLRPRGELLTASRARRRGGSAARARRAPSRAPSSGASPARTSPSPACRSPRAARACARTRVARGGSCSSAHHGSSPCGHPLAQRLVEVVAPQRAGREPVPRRGDDELERLRHLEPLVARLLRRSPRPRAPAAPAGSSGTSAAVNTRASRRGTTYGAPRNELTWTTSSGSALRGPRAQRRQRAPLGRVLLQPDRGDRLARPDPPVEVVPRDAERERLIVGDLHGRKRDTMPPWLSLNVRSSSRPTPSRARSAPPRSPARSAAASSAPG